MKKRVVVIIAAVLLVILLFPIKQSLKDGGTVEYNAILYSVVKEHSMTLSEQGEKGYNVGTRVRVLFFEVYNDVKFVAN